MIGIEYRNICSSVDADHQNYKLPIYLCYHFRHVTTMFKHQIIFKFVKNTTLQGGVELETTSTGVPHLTDCAKYWLQ